MTFIFRHFHQKKSGIKPTNSVSLTKNKLEASIGKSNPIINTDADIVFPHAFTPNGNGPSGGYYSSGSLDNDIFFPHSSGVVEFKFQVFNRWGELIFETDDIKQGWDGYYKDKICLEGIYVWKAYAKLNNGKVFNKTGDVLLLR